MKFLDIFRGNKLIDGGFTVRVQTYYLGKPDVMISGGWRAWEEKAKKDHPIKWFVLETIPEFIQDYWAPIANRYHNLKCKYWLKHHHIKIDVDRFFVRYEEYSQKPIENYHWLDSDSKILYANFQILVDFVEKESDIVDWSADPVHQKAKDEFMELYKWWTEERPKRVNPFPSMSDYGLKGSIFNIDRSSPGYKRWQEAHDEQDKKEAEYENEDTEMLIRLITMRMSLWS